MTGLLFLTSCGIRLRWYGHRPPAETPLLPPRPLKQMETRMSRGLFIPRTVYSGPDANDGNCCEAVFSYRGAKDRNGSPAVCDQYKQAGHRVSE